MKKGVKVFTGLVAVASTATIAQFYLQYESRMCPASFSLAYVKEAVQPVSFSEVENAKAALEALAQEYVLNVKALQAKSQADRSGIPLSIQRTKTLRLLLQGYGEFRGTSAEPAVVRSILDFLGLSGEHSTWLNVYTDYLYRHPTDSLVEELKEQALLAAARCNGEPELHKAFEFVSMVPGNLRSGIKPTLVSFEVPIFSDERKEKLKRAHESVL